MEVHQSHKILVIPALYTRLGWSRHILCLCFP